MTDHAENDGTQTSVAPKKNAAAKRGETVNRPVLAGSLPMFFGLWEIVSRSGIVNIVLFPPPSTVLTAIIDCNKLQSYGPTAEVQVQEPLADKWKAFGFATAEVDGHDVEALRSVLNSLPIAQNKPTAVICHTVKGKGVAFAENNLEWHHKSRFKDTDIQGLLKALEDR